MKRLRDYLYPSLEITTVMGCRVNCKYCPQSALVSKYFEQDNNRARELTIDVFKTCIDKMPQNTIVIFSGASEPCLNENVYEMIEYANSKHHILRLLTTLEGMTIEGFERIKDIPFEAVVLHAPDMDRYAKIELSDNYFNILDRVLAAKKKDGKPFIDLCNCQGTFDEQFLAHVNWDIPGLNRKTLLHDRAGNLCEDGLDSKRNEGRIYCGASFPKLNHFMMLPDGTVCLCCMDFGQKHVLGNLVRDSYKDIIDSNELKKVRSGMKHDLEMDILCRNCSYGRSLKDLIFK